MGILSCLTRSNTLFLFIKLSAQYTNPIKYGCRVSYVRSGIHVVNARWSDTVPIFLLGLGILLVFLILPLASYTDTLILISSILTPLITFLLGVLGLWTFNRNSEDREDRIQTLLLWISIGLLMISLSEMAGTIVKLIQNPPPTEIIVGLVQMPGLLLWGFGILQYLRSVNSALKIFESEKLWIILLMLTSLATLSLIVINALYNPWIGMIENIVLSPLVIGLVLFTVIVLGLVLIFRQGEFGRPLFFIFIGFFLYLIRTAQWAFATSVIGTPLNSLIALEACVFFGVGFILTRNLGSEKQRI